LFHELRVKAQSGERCFRNYTGNSSGVGFHRAAGVCPSARRPPIPAFVASAGISKSSGGGQRSSGPWATVEGRTAAARTLHEEENFRIARYGV
jgi:hypothetical protein